MIWLSVVAFLVSAFTGAWVLRWARRRGAVYGTDMPQRIHLGEVPRLGGVGLLAGLFVAWFSGLASSLWLGDPSHLGLRPWVLAWCVALLPAALSGLAEDWTLRLPPWARLLLTVSSGVLAVAVAGLAIQRLGFDWLDALLAAWPWLGLGLTVFAVAGLPHAFNIIDGCNGLAGMVALIVALALAHVALQVGDRALAALLVTMAASTAGFLLWNYPRGALFAGDGGAYLWGGVIALGSVALVQRHPQVSPWFPMLLLMYPVSETLFSIYRKLVRGESPGMADALHLHQLVFRRLVSSVLDEDEARSLLKRNNRTAPYLWGFMALTVVPALLFWRFSGVLLAFCALFAISYVIAYLALVRFKVPRVFRRSRL